MWKRLAGLDGCRRPLLDSFSGGMARALHVLRPTHEHACYQRAFPVCAQLRPCLCCDGALKPAVRRVQGIPHRFACTPRANLLSPITAEADVLSP